MLRREFKNAILLKIADILVKHTEYGNPDSEYSDKEISELLLDVIDILNDKK